MAKKRDKATTKNDSEVLVSKPSAKRQVVTVPNDNVLTIYANNASLEVSNWDVKIRLGQIQSATKELITVRDLVYVFMSHEHAKAFVESLSKTLATALAGLHEARQQQAKADVTH